MARQQEPRELSFLDHLEELRWRLFRCLIYWGVGMGVGWWQRTPLLEVLRWPAEAGAQAAGIESLPFRIFDPAGGFILAMQIAMIAGLVLASPFILLEVWRFVKPALERSERGWFLVAIPAASGLFALGIAFCYWIAPFFFRYLFWLNTTMGVEGELMLTSYLGFMIKLLVGTGLCFELPLVIMFLAWIGLVRSEWLIKRWRHALVVILILAAVITPTNDPLTMTMFAVPLVLLFLLSLWLVKIVEKRRARAEARAAAEEEPGSASPLPSDFPDLRVGSEERGEEAPR